MKISKFIPVIALAMGLSTLSFAGNPKGETKAAPTETKTQTEVKWFQFNGQPGDENIASEYTVVATPTCTSTTATYLCQIQIEVQSGNSNLPNLDAEPLDTRMKTTPNPQ